MTFLKRSSAPWVLIWLTASAFACGSQTSTTSEEIDHFPGSGGAAGYSPTPDGGIADTGSGGMTDDARGGSGGAAGATGGSAGSSGSAGAGGGAGGATPEDAGPASCDSAFKTAVIKDCTSDWECSLIDHSDCCGTVVVAIRKGTDAAFSTAEQAFQSCVPGCGTRGCSHATMAEDGNTPGMVGQAIFARCDNQRCTSVVAVAPNCVATKDCAVGQICVTYASGLPSAPVRRECRSNPCGMTDATTCTCAGSVCKGFGIGSCSIKGTDVTCSDGLR
jgi:hypothetical protein